MTSRTQAFTTPGAITFNVPANVTIILITMVAGGGSGGGVSIPGAPAAISGGAGGGAGEYCRRVPLQVTPGGTVSGVVGRGGVAATYDVYPHRGDDGVASSFGPYKCLPGFGGQGDATVSNGCAGGGFGVPGPALPPPGSNYNNDAGDNARYEVANWCSGASGAGRTTCSIVPGTTGNAGGNCEGQLGGQGGLHVFPAPDGGCKGGGSGGGASPFGPGGDGGSTNVSGTAGAFGAGGGGNGWRQSAAFPAITAGAGGGGYILVEWEE